MKPGRNVIADGARVAGWSWGAIVSG